MTRGVPGPAQGGLCTRASLPSCHAVSAKTASVFFAVLATACFGLMITAGVGVIPVNQGLFMASGFGGAVISIIISAVLFILDKPAPRPQRPAPIPAAQSPAPLPASPPPSSRGLTLFETGPAQTASNASGVDDEEGDREEAALTLAHEPEEGVESPKVTPLSFTETSITAFKYSPEGNLYFATENSVWMKTVGEKPVKMLDVDGPLSHFVVTEGSVFATSGNTLTSPTGATRSFDGEILHLAAAGDNLAVVYCGGAGQDCCVLVSQEDLADVLSVDVPQSKHHKFAIIDGYPTLFSFIAGIPAIQKTVIGSEKRNYRFQFERPREVSGDLDLKISNFSLHGTQIIWNVFYKSKERGEFQVLVLQGTTDYKIKKTQVRNLLEDLPEHSKAMMLPSMRFVTATEREVRVWTPHKRARSHFKYKLQKGEALDGVELVGSRLVIQSRRDKYFDFEELDFSVAVPKPPKLGGIKRPEKRELYSTEAPVSEVLRVGDQLFFATTKGIFIKGEGNALLVHALENPSHFVVTSDGTIIAASGNQLHIQGKDPLEFDGEILHLAHHGARCVVVYRSGDQDKLALINQESLNTEKFVDLPASAQHVFAVVEGKPSLFSAIDAEEGVFSIRKTVIDDPSKNHTFAFEGNASGIFNRNVSSFSIDGDRIVWNTFWKEGERIKQRVILQYALASYTRVVVEKTATLKKLPTRSSVFVLPGNRFVSVSDRLVLVSNKKKNGFTHRPLNRGNPTLGKPYCRGTALVLPLLEKSKSTLLELDFATKPALVEERLEEVEAPGGAHTNPQSRGSGSSSPSKTPPPEQEKVMGSTMEVASPKVSKSVRGAGQFPILPELPKNGILSFLDLAGLNAMKGTCRHFRDYFKENLYAYRRLNGLACLEVAKKTAAMMTHKKDTALVEIVKAEAQYDFTIAKETAATIENTNFQKARAFREIVKVEAYSDLAAAKKTAATIEPAFCKVEALCEIAKIDPKHDFAAAKEVAAAIKNASRKGQAFACIVRAEAHNDLAAAKETAATIEEASYKEMVLADLVKAEVLSDLAAAKKTAAIIESTVTKALALIYIIEAEAHNDLAAAKKTAATIEHSHGKSRALIHIIKVEAQDNLAAAKNTVATIEEIFGKVMALCAIAEIDPQNDFAAAKNTAATIENFVRKGQALGNIVRVEAQYNLTAAKNTAATIERILDKSWALYEIVKIEMHSDLGAAKNTALAIEDAYYKTKALCEIAKFYLSRN